MSKGVTIALCATTAVCLVGMTALGTYVLTRPAAPGVATAPVPAVQAAPVVQAQPMYTQADVENIVRNVMQVQGQQAQPNIQQAPTAPVTPPRTVNVEALRQNGAKIIQTLNTTLAGVRDEAGRSEANKNLPPIQIFFDPRCPYCHSLFEKISGKAPINWIPVSALSPVEGGIAAGATILEEEKKGAGAGVSAIGKAFSHQLANIQPTNEQNELLQKNFAALSMMAQTLPAGIDPGVPFAVIPKADGTFETHVGYNQGDENKILEAYGK